MKTSDGDFSGRTRTAQDIVKGFDAPNMLAETMKILCRNIWMICMVALGAYMEVHHADINFAQAFGLGFGASIVGAIMSFCVAPFVGRKIGSLLYKR